MLPPALGGLRFRVPPVPGRHAPGSMEKISYRAVSRKTGESYHTALADGKGGIFKFSAPKDREEDHKSRRTAIYGLFSAFFF